MSDFFFQLHITKSTGKAALERLRLHQSDDALVIVRLVCFFFVLVCENSQHVPANASLNSD